MTTFQLSSLFVVFILLTNRVVGNKSLQTNFVNVAEDAGKVNNVVPVFWHVPKSGGTSMKGFSHCLNLVVGSEAGRFSGSPPSLDVLRFNDGRTFVNADISSKEGIYEAEKLGLADRHPEDVLITSHINTLAEHLVTADHPGALFTVLRHPVERATSLFYYLQHAWWEPTYAPELQELTLLDYSLSKKSEQNWMVRFLSGCESRQPTRDDLEYAKSILAHKTVIGLTNDMSESLNRFGSYFGWDQRNEWKQCLAKYSKKGKNAYDHPQVQPGSAEWDAIVKNNEFDMELYDYAVNLFENQGHLF